MNDDIIIEMLENVRGIQWISPTGTILRGGVRYAGKTNPNGAISGLCGNGEWLGVKPGEFKFIKAPEWVLRIHAKYDKNIKVSLGADDNGV